jgi:hypothetical protein
MLLQFILKIRLVGLFKHKLFQWILKNRVLKNNNKRMKNLRRMTLTRMKTHKLNQILSLNMKIECIRDFLDIFSIIFVK